jgi:hypothetical protein
MYDSPPNPFLKENELKDYACISNQCVMRRKRLSNKRVMSFPYPIVIQVEPIVLLVRSDNVKSSQ